MDHDTYLFINDDDRVIEEQLFRNEDLAEAHGMDLMRARKETITVAKVYTVLDPKDFEP